MICCEFFLTEYCKVFWLYYAVALFSHQHSDTTWRSGSILAHYFFACRLPAQCWFFFFFHFNWDKNGHGTVKLILIWFHYFIFFFLPSKTEFLWTLLSKVKMKMLLGEDSDILCMNLFCRHFQRDLKIHIVEDFAHVLSCNKRLVHNIC